MTQAAAVPPPPQQEESFTAIESVSLQFVPRQQEAPGWRLEEDPIVVPGDRLASYLGPEAVTFLRYGAIDMAAGDYSETAGPGFATLQIFRFPDFVKAFGAYSMHKIGPQQYVNIANEAFLGKHTLHLWRGPFYIRIIGGGSPDAAPAIMRLANFVADRMPAAPARPAVFNFLPTANRVPNSERYAADEGFGQKILGNSFQAAFNVNGKVDNGLIIPAANPQAAARILDGYRALYLRSGKLLDPVPNLGEDNFTGEDTYLGRTVAFRMDRFVIAFNGYNERQALVDLAAATATRILGSIRKQLVTADKIAEQGTQQPAQTSTAPGWAQQPRQ